MSKKAVRDSKAGRLAPAQESRTAVPSNNSQKIEVVQGNVGLVTTSLLNAINNNLAAIRTLLENTAQKPNG